MHIQVYIDDHRRGDRVASAAGLEPLEFVEDFEQATFQGDFVPRNVRQQVAVLDLLHLVAYAQSITLGRTGAGSKDG